MKTKGLLRDVAAIMIFLILIIIFNYFILNNSLAFGVAFLFFGVNYAIILSHENKYGRENFPYKPYKSKKKIGERILIGLLAGLHYIFFIGNYNHKKYNTQIWYPKTLECYFGNVSQMIILIAYLFISVNLFRILGYYSLFFMIIPIITNIVSLKIVKKR